MYRYVDRQVATLGEGQRLLVRAMRDWGIAARRRRCPVEAVTLRFVAHRVVGALEPFHMTMCILAGSGRWKLQVACPCFATVTEGEALILSLFDAAATGKSEQLSANCEALVSPRSADRLEGEVRDLTAALAALL